jgi:hypothetical protein
LALYPGWRAAGHPLDSRGDAQYKAKENVYQTIFDAIDIPGDYLDAWLRLRCQAKPSRQPHGNARVTDCAFCDFFGADWR